MFAGRGVLVVLFFCLLSISPAFGQKSKAQLQKEKQQNLARIKEVEGILSETVEKKTNSLGELNALNQRIRQQENLINSIRGEIGLLDGEISENNDIIEALEKDLQRLRKEFAEMLYTAQKTRNSISPLSFLFSSQSLNDLLTRLRYMDQYAEARSLQARQIVKVQDELSGQVKMIEGKRAEMQTLLNEQMDESRNLADLRKKQDRLVKALAKEERKLRRDLESTKKTIAMLDKRIEEIIREEMARARREASKESVALSSNFEENKSKFAYPVSGFVSLGFGRQSHPVLKGVVLQNEGVNIQTKKGEKVRSIFEGEVRAVAVMPTIGNSVIINHGNYFTVYSGLKEVFVRTGQKVATNEEIGEVMTNSEGVSELRFRIYKDRTPLDPQQWLGRL
ncbi:MAG TPA: peptidoglycan DD-metalloendopeptidase family protein [Cyclobacteriaceae bacterium]|nr:peptidoglycan DD-metalloendopeptidase family protein [Cyclobacteriaceae bacterium]